jgi:hypothetical protein
VPWNAAPIESRRVGPLCGGDRWVIITGFVMEVGNVLGMVVVMW